MKRTIIGLAILALAAATVFGAGPRGRSDWSGTSHDTVMTALPIEQLSNAERDALIFMIEEEKLARDVYQTLYERWELRTFANIAESEQHHMDSVQSLLERYGLAVPETIASIGVFQNAQLQSMYDDLVGQGSQSLDQALIVGATIEDVDIADLERLLAEEIDNQDITMVYENLVMGSENHLRAFVGQLERFGGAYTPQFLSPDRYQDIVAGQTGGSGSGNRQGTRQRVAQWENVGSAEWNQRTGPGQTGGPGGERWNGRSSGRFQTDRPGGRWN